MTDPEPWPPFMYDLKPFSNSASIEVVKHAAAEHFGLTVKQLEGKDRRREIAKPRQVAMAAALEISGQSTTAVGQRFKRDHTTVLHAAKTVSASDELSQHLDLVKRRALVYAGEHGVVDALVHELLMAANKSIREQIRKDPRRFLISLLSAGE